MFSLKEAARSDYDFVTAKTALKLEKINKDKSVRKKLKKGVSLTSFPRFIGRNFIFFVSKQKENNP